MWRHQLNLPDGSSHGSSPAEGEAEVSRLSDQVRGGEGGRRGRREGGGRGKEREGEGGGREWGWGGGGGS